MTADQQFTEEDVQRYARLLHESEDGPNCDCSAWAREIYTDGARLVLAALVEDGWRRLFSEEDRCVARRTWSSGVVMRCMLHASHVDYRREHWAPKTGDWTDDHEDSIQPASRERGKSLARIEDCGDEPGMPTGIGDMSRWMRVECECGEAIEGRHRCLIRVAAARSEPVVTRPEGADQQ